jgi:hypothetical protein
MSIILLLATTFLLTGQALVIKIDRYKTLSSAVLSAAQVYKTRKGK